MTSAQVAGRHAFDDDALTQVERLLLQYPNVSAPELARIMSFLRDGTILQIALLSTSPGAWQNAEKIRAEYPHGFATSGRERLLVIAAITAYFFVPFLLWAIAP